MKTVVEFLKSEAVLSAAWFLAVISMIAVPPSAAYLEYIDYRSLGILWSLMVIMKMFQTNGVFEYIGQKLLKKTGKLWQLIAVLVFLCFFLSMFITNDVALITFVPFAVLMLKKSGRADLMIPVIVLQTIAANLGSMMTPVGNPQNLYLYGLAGMPLNEFLLLMLPYTAAAFVMLCVGIFLLGRKGEMPKAGTSGAAAAGSAVVGKTAEIGGTLEAGDPAETEPQMTRPGVLVIYLGLFVAALLVVARIIPYTVLAAVVLIVTLAADRKIIGKADYALLLTFIGFFIFIGNVGNIPAVSEGLKKVVDGHELLAGVAASQVISNVPAALLLSGFTNCYSELILGVNFGGLGTLIASMASLISYKLYAAEEGAKTGKYLMSFTWMNVVFLLVLLALRAVF